MKDEREEAKRFSDNLDRLLSGKEVGEGQSEEVLRTLEFARKMKSLRTEPSIRFQSHLKQRLLTRIAESESVSQPERGWFSKLIRQPVWQTVTAVLMIAIVTGVMWGAGVFHGPEVTPESSGRQPVTMSSVPASSTVLAPAPTMTITATSTMAPSIAAMPPVTTQAPPVFAGTALLQITGSANQDIYLNSTNNPVDISITIQNVSGQSVELTRPILSLMQGTTMQPVYTFKAGQQIMTLAANSSVSFSWEWDQQNTQGDLVVPGEYYVELEDLDLQGQAVKLTPSSSIQFQIKPAN